MIYCWECDRNYSHKSHNRHILTKTHLNKAYRFKHMYNVKNILVGDVDDVFNDIMDEYTQIFHSFEMLYHFGDIKKIFCYPGNVLSEYYNKNDLVNITFNFYSNVSDMFFNYYMRQPKSLLETTLIKNLDRYPEKLKILEDSYIPYYQYLVMKYYGVVERDSHGHIIRYYLEADWKEKLPLAPSEEFKKILVTIY